MPEPPNHVAGEQEAYLCFACLRGGHDAYDLLRQGCEGHPQPVVPLSRATQAEEALKEIDELATSIVLNDEDAQVRHQRIADVARNALDRER